MVTRKNASAASESIGLSSGIGTLKPSISQKVSPHPNDSKSDYSRWRFQCIDGRQTWHYLESDKEATEWKQTFYDKYFLGLELDAPVLPTPKTPRAAAENGLEFFSKLQLPTGNWACEYGGPMFLLPGFVITWHVTKTTISTAMQTECRNYILARQNPKDHGWGLHIEGITSVLGTALNYTALRLLGVDADDTRMVEARKVLHHLGGATHGPHWAKFWLSVLGVAEWDIVNPAPPELWLLPNWVPFHPWRWWIHIRQVYLPMSYISSKRWVGPKTKIVLELRDELYTQPYESINWSGNRNSIASSDNFHPKTAILNILNWGITNIWYPYLRPQFLIDKAEAWVMKLIQMEDENTEYSNLGPVNSPMNTVACYIHANEQKSEAVQKHLDHMHDFLWMKDEGMLCNGTNGVQNWDTSFAMQAIVAADLHLETKWKAVISKGLDYLKTQQIQDNCVDQEVCYRHPRKGAWGFSNRMQGYTVSDTTAEAITAILQAQNIPGIEEIISRDRIHDAINVLLTMQNPDTQGCASYELRRAGTWLENLNAAEVFGRIMVEYDYPECTTAVRIGLSAFHKLEPAYRTAEIKAFLSSTLQYMLNAQRDDGSWYGSWGICFTYATMFGLESLALADLSCNNSEAARNGCQFLVEHQNDDGGWGESYESCEKMEWHYHPDGSQVVNTAWALIALLEAKYQDRKVIDRGIRLILDRQMPNGEWKQEGIEGVFNKSCMISYPNYKFIFPIKALGMYAKRYENSMPE